MGLNCVNCVNSNDSEMCYNRITMSIKTESNLVIPNHRCNLPVFFFNKLDKNNGVSSDVWPVFLLSFEFLKILTHNSTIIIACSSLRL